MTAGTDTSRNDTSRRFSNTTALAFIDNLLPSTPQSLQECRVENHSLLPNVQKVNSRAEEVWPFAGRFQ
jgi:hypothetical protein